MGKLIVENSINGYLLGKSPLKAVEPFLVFVIAGAEQNDEQSAGQRQR